MSAFPEGSVSAVFESCGTSLIDVSRQPFNLSEAILPHTRMEEWSYSNFGKLVGKKFCVASEVAAQVEVPNPVSSYAERITFLNGYVQGDQNAGAGQATGAEQSLPYVRIIRETADIPEEFLDLLAVTPSAFAAVPDLVASTLVCIDVPAGKEVSIEITRLACELADTDAGVPVVPARVFVRAGKGARVRVVEDFHGIGSGNYLTMHGLTYLAEAESELTHLKLVRESKDANHYSVIWGKQAEKAIVKTVQLNTEGAFIRNEIHPTIDGEYGEAWLIGANVLSSSQHVDNTTVIDHVAPNCESHELYKGMYGGSSKGAFSGTIIVREDAQKTNAYQSNASLLCSDNAESNSKPQLKIWADDVKCSHGATVGQLDEDALFYLRARGIPESTAKVMLTRAYVSEVFGHFDDDALAETAHALLEAKLQEVL